MNHSPAEIMAKVLRDEGIFNAHDSAVWPLWISFLPDTKAQGAALYDTSPERDTRVLADGKSYWAWGLQLLVRSSGYQAGWQKAVEAATHFDTYGNEIVVMSEETDADEYHVDSIQLTTKVLPLGTDSDTQMQMFSLNALLRFRGE